MPARKGETRLIRRLVLLLDALTTQWSSRDQLLAAVGYVVEHDEHASRELRADIDALRALGFAIERSEGSRDPHYRLVGHARFPSCAPPPLPENSS